MDLRLDGVTKTFGGLRALGGVGLTVRAGTIFGLIGPNGAGKTTLVNLVTGVYAPDTGEVKLAGQSIGGLAMHEIARRGLVRSFQVTRLFGGLTVRENLLTAFYARRPSANNDGEAQAE